MKSVTQGHKDTKAQGGNWHVLFRRRASLVAVIWLVGLSIIIVAGTGVATFHGDEAMQITMSQDYATAFIDSGFGRLAVTPPYTVDSPDWLRLINGSVNRYAIGLSWHVAGMSVSDLPGNWQWPLSYEENVTRGNRPSDALLNSARLPSALFLALSTAVMFGIGRQVGGCWLAYIVSGLYAVNPVILLNGRRAMQEGSFLFFGLLTVLIAILISQRKMQDGSEENVGRGVRRLYDMAVWLGMILVGGFTLASKHSGIVFVAGAFGWIVVARLFTSPPTLLSTYGEASSRTRRLITNIVELIISGTLIVTVFVALSPALWNDPLARLGDLVSERQKLVESQVVANPDAPTTLHQRIEGIVSQPFIKPVEHYEAAFWGNATPIQMEIERYMASPLSGLQGSFVIGVILTLLAAWGIIRAMRGQVGSRGQSWGLLIWFTITAASLLVNPLPWQRYYLPLYPVAIIMAGIGLLSVVRFVQNRIQSESPLAA